jgi:hypothetical protein
METKRGVSPALFFEFNADAVMLRDIYSASTS